VARRARAVDLAAIALTDHDTTDGVAEAAQEGTKLGVRIIPGCEFSVRAPWGELHVLALFLPYAHEGLQTFLRDTRTARRRRGEQIVAKLQDLGVAIVEAEVVVAAQRVFSADRRQQIERHGLAARRVRKCRETAQGDNPVVLDNRQEVRRFQLVSPEAVLVVVAIGIERGGRAIESAACRMASVVSRVRGDRHIGM